MPLVKTRDTRVRLPTPPPFQVEKFDHLFFYSNMKLIYYICFLFFSILLFGVGINIQRNTESVSLSWNTESNKYYSVFHSENLNGNFIPVENKYKLRNLDNFN